MSHLLKPGQYNYFTTGKLYVNFEKSPFDLLTGKSGWVSMPLWGFSFNTLPRGLSQPEEPPARSWGLEAQRHRVISYEDDNDSMHELFPVNIGKVSTEMAMLKVCWHLGSCPEVNNGGVRQARVSQQLPTGTDPNVNFEQTDSVNFQQTMSTFEIQTQELV